LLKNVETSLKTYTGEASQLRSLRKRL